MVRGDARDEKQPGVGAAAHLQIHGCGVTGSDPTALDYHTVPANHRSEPGIGAWRRAVTRTEIRSRTNRSFNSSSEDLLTDSEDVNF